MKTYRQWTPAEEELLRARYPVTTTRLIADLLGLAWGTVKNKTNRMGLKKSPEYQQQPLKVIHGDDSYPPGISHPRPGVTVHRMRR